MKIKPLKPRSNEKKDNEQGKILASIKSRFEVYKLVIETFVLFLGLVSLVAFSFGTAFTFLYFSRIHFNSGGITWSDAVSVVFLVSGFFGLTTILLAYSTIAGLPIARLIHIIVIAPGKILKKFRKKKIDDTNNDPMGTDLGPIRIFSWRKGNEVLIFCGFLVLLIFGIASLSFPTGVQLYFFALLAAGTIFSFSVFGLSEHRYCLLPQRQATSKFERWMNKLSDNKRQLIFSFALISVIVLLVIGVGQDASVAMVDIRKQNATVRLSKEDFRQFVQRSSRLGLAINPCETLDHDSTIITGVDVLWHKLGTKGLLRYPTVPIGADNSADRPAREIRYELDNSSFSVMEERNSSKFIPKCVEIPSDKLFNFTEARLNTQGREMLEQYLRWITAIPDDWKIRIVAHSSIPLNDSKNKASFDTGRQASEIKNFFLEKFHIRADRIEAIGKENNEPKQECTSTQSLFDKRDCDAMNRRVEVFAAKDF